ncbi:MAG: DUF1858 domain-containing protein [Silicimonas sp.]|jgi:hybrid cluster-associated redox disulfide protein|nr:DUF1858 domain-containing protein [Silicimonas sp.]
MLQDIDDPDLPLAEILRAWPETMAVFVERGMLCVGCPITPFHTVVDACREHELDEEELRTELRAIVRASNGPGLSR